MKTMKIFRKRKEQPSTGARSQPSPSPSPPPPPPKPPGSYEPVKPKGGGWRALPFLLIIGIILVISAAYDFIRESDPFRLCETYLKQNPQIREVVGEVREVKPWFPVSISTSGQQGRATMTFLVEGTKGTVKAQATLTKQRGAWKILTASYEDNQGKIHPLVMETPGAERSGRMPVTGDIPVTGKPSLPGDTPLIAVRPAVAEPIQEGLMHLKQNRLDKAVAAFSRAIDADPTNDKAHYLRGRTLARQNQEVRAVEDLNRAVALNPRNADAHNWLGWIHSRNNRNDEAIVSLTKAIELRPNNGWAYYNRGRCYYRKGEAAKSMEDARMACTLGIKDACKVYDRLKKT
ncbi:MAG: tetratricopeptide repeat protein [Syntrophaceae bacterium]|nr:tetratricopeptide repeat protein [Syntrophaceae bacterium]